MSFLVNYKIFRRNLWVLLVALGMFTLSSAGSGATELNGPVPQNIESKEAKFQVQEVLRVAIGTGETELGVITPEEANPEGPMSFVVSPAGELYVLDQTNSRIQVYENGQWKKTIPIPATTYSDIALLPDGKIALLDCLVKKEITVIDQEGKVVTAFSLIKPAIPKPEEIIGIYYIAGGNWPGLWGSADNSSFLMAEKDLRPVPNPVKIPGILTPDGRRLLKVEIVDEKKAAVSLSDEVFRSWKDFQVSFPLPFGAILGVWQDQKQNIYLAANVFNLRQERNQVVVLNSSGKEIARIDMYVSKEPNDVFYPVRVTEDGSIYQLVIEDKEVVIRKYKL